MLIWPLIVYFAAVLVLVGGMLGLSYLLGERHRDKQTGEPYESGVVSTGSARQRVSAKFYLTAMFFVVFDLESVFIFAWAVAAREVGWVGYIDALIFIGVLVATLVYLWKRGALDWSEAQSRRRTRAAAPLKEARLPKSPSLQTVEQKANPTR